MIFRHVLPNIAGPILVTSMLDIGTMMMEIAGLSFPWVGSPASGGRVGKHDEQRQEHAADLSMDRIISGIGHLCIGCDI